MLHLQLFEAFALNKAKELTKQWKESGAEERYDNLFGKGIYRIYLPFSSSKEDLEAYEKSIKKHELYYDISSCLNTNGYKIISYTDGTADKIDGNSNNIFKIGKLLQRFEPTLKPKFDSDKLRDGAKILQQSLSICISRHAYDIGGMSTGRGWTSCMNLDSGENCHFVPNDIKEGTIIAYLIKSSDKNIKNPISRILLKPHTQEDANGNVKTILYPERRIYGTDVKSFNDSVLSWCRANSAKSFGQFTLNKKLYPDTGADTVNIAPDGYEVSSIVSSDMSIVVKNETELEYLMNGEGDILLSGRGYSQLQKLDTYQSIVYVTAYDTEKEEVFILNQDGKTIFNYKNSDEEFPKSVGNGYFLILTENESLLVNHEGKVVCADFSDIDYNKENKNILLKKEGSYIIFNKITSSFVNIKLDKDQAASLREIGEFILIGRSIFSRNIYKIKNNKAILIARNVRTKFSGDNQAIVTYKNSNQEEICAVIFKDKFINLPVFKERTAINSYYIKAGEKTDLVIVYEDNEYQSHYLYSTKRKAELFNGNKADSFEFVMNKSSDSYSNAVIMKGSREGLYDVLRDKYLTEASFLVIRRIEPKDARPGLFFKATSRNKYGEVSIVVDSKGKTIAKVRSDSTDF